MNLLDETLNHTTNGSKPKAGKWTIIVQVHELRGIKSQFGSGGIPRPVIHVNVWDQTKIINPNSRLVVRMVGAQVNVGFENHFWGVFTIISPNQIINFVSLG